MSKLPDPWRSLSSVVNEIKDRVRNLEMRSPWANTGLEPIDSGQVVQDGDLTITAPGALVIDGGDVVMIDQAPSATELFKIGTMPNGDRGIRIRRTDGSVAFFMRDTLGIPGSKQSVGMADSDGATIAGTGLFSAGLGAPYIPIIWTPVNYDSASLAQSTSSATFAATHESRHFKQNNVVWPQFMVKCSDATTAAEVQLYSVSGLQPLAKQNGDPLTITVPAGTTAYTLFEFSDYVYLPGIYGLPVHYQIQARRTAGTGSVSVAPVRSIGVRDGLVTH